MKTINLTYSQLITIIIYKGAQLQYIEESDRYQLFITEVGILWESIILKGSADATNFETNYKNTSNKPGKNLFKLDTGYANNTPIVRAESRPDGTAHYFTTAGDDDSNIGQGDRLEWDFSNSDNDITDPAPSVDPIPVSHKRKRLDMVFKDEIYLKEGTIYFHNIPKGCYADFYVICPDGAVYLDRNDDPQVASGEVIISHYVNKHPMQGSVPMGDELNTESANINAMPAGYIIRLEVTTPDTDVTSNGVVELELFRSRSCLLPGESI